MASVPNEINTENTATVQADTPSTRVLGLDKFNQLPQEKKIGIMVVAAATIAMLAGAWMWSQSPDYRVLFANISDHDGASIMNALEQSNVPYKLSGGGSAILVPGDQVHEIRLRLAGQGLPRSGLAGFELMENQKFGTSQFLEQINYQRALEGELSRSVQSLAAVQSARVHLAISKPSVFARERQQPTVSVLLNLYPGRVLNDEQVSAIVHLVSSSIPNLPTKNVTVVDQNGNLLSEQASKKESKFNAQQLEYVHDIERNYAKRIETILSPITGSANVRAQVTADLDFSRIERAEEIYRPNNTPDDPASIRSQQTMESLSTGNKLDGGIPGALTNRPPEPAIAPIELGEEDSEKEPDPLPTDKRKEATINYEVDKTVQHTQLPTGNIKRLSAAVVVNYRRTVDEEGNAIHIPLSEEEIQEINQLVRDAMGYNEERGDTLTVTNSLFSDVDDGLIVPLWKDPDVITIGMEIGKQLIIAIIVLFFLLKVLKPFLKSLTQDPEQERKEAAQLTDKTGAGEGGGQNVQFAPDGTPLLNQESAEEAMKKEQLEKELQKIRQMAVDEPAIVASVVKEWVNMDNDGVKKSAILLMSLGEQEASSVFKFLSPKEVQKLGTAMSTLNNINQNEIVDVVNEFNEQAAGKTALGHDASEYIRKVLTNALGDEKAANLIDRILHGGDTSGIEGLKWMDAPSIVELIKNEHPQIIATILVHLERDHASEILSLFTERLRNDTLLRIATLDSIQPDALRELNDVLTKLLSGSTNIRKAPMGGVRTAAEILNFVPTAQETSVIDNIKKYDEDLAQQIMDEMFVFDNLADVDDQGIQLLLREVQSESLVIALKGAQEEVREKIFRNMSKRAVEALKEDLEGRGPVRISEVEAEQKEILKVLRQLAESGQIVLGGKGEDSYV